MCPCVIALAAVTACQLSLLLPVFRKRHPHALKPFEMFEDLPSGGFCRRIGCCSLHKPSLLVVDMSVQRHLAHPSSWPQFCLKAFRVSKGHSLEKHSNLHCRPVKPLLSPSCIWLLLEHVWLLILDLRLDCFHVWDQCSLQLLQYSCFSPLLIWQRPQCHVICSFRLTREGTSVNWKE